MKNLTKIGIEAGTDKANYHLFTEVYEDVFSKYTSPRILEIGVYNYASVQMYIDYFDSPYIVAMDIDDKTEYLNPKWKFVQGDQTNIHDLQKCVQDEQLFDIIVEDGGHTMKQQQISFGYLIDYIEPGGYYILEDLHTSFRWNYIDEDAEFTSYEMLMKIQNNELNFSNYIDINQQKRILDKIESIMIWSKDPNDLSDSTTAIIQIKK